MSIPILSNIRDKVGDFLSRGYNERQEQKQALIQQEQQQRGRDAMMIAQGMGIDPAGFGPRTDTTPQEQQRLGGIMNAMASPNSQTRAVGNQLAKTYAADQGLLTPAANLALQGQAQNQAMLDMNKYAIDEEQALNKTFRQETAGYRQGIQGIQLAQMALKQDSPQSRLNVARLAIQQLDQSMITNPEIQNLIQQSGLAGQWTQFVEWASGDGLITPEMANELIGAMEALGKVYQTQLDAVSQQTRDLVQSQYIDRGIPVNPDNVLTLTGDNAFTPIYNPNFGSTGGAGGGVGADGMTDQERANKAASNPNKVITTDGTVLDRRTLTKID